MKKILLCIAALLLLALIVRFPVIFSYITLGYMLIVSVIAFTYKAFTGEHAPSCSVIIPVFNESRHIYETVQSVMASDYKNFELIIVDDGSTDDSRDWIEKAKAEYVNIKTYYCQKNGGKKSIAGKNRRFYEKKQLRCRKRIYRTSQNNARKRSKAAFAQILSGYVISSQYNFSYIQ